MDLTETIVPKSDQLNADDLMAGSVTVTISDVSKGSAEQPVDVKLVEFPGRAYRPSKSMRRVMVMAWGPEAANYTGHRLTLYRNPEITFGANKVGGIEISAMSHIDKTITIALTAKRGQRKAFTVTPLEDTAKPTSVAAEIVDEWVEAFSAATDVTHLQQLWADATKAKVTHTPQIIAAKDARKTELT